MSSIRIYDVDARHIAEIAEEFDASVADIVNTLLSAVSDNDIDLEEYFIW